MDIKQAFKTLRIIHFAMLLGTILFALVQYGIVVDFSQVIFNESSLYLYILLFLTTAILFVEKFIFNNGKKQANEFKSMDDKWRNYQSTKIMTWALIEGLILLSIVFIIIEPNAFFMIFTFVLQFLLILKKPSLLEAKNDFNFDFLEA